jgi:hypothetical protein
MKWGLAIFLSFSLIIGVANLDVPVFVTNLPSVKPHSKRL